MQWSADASTGRPQAKQRTRHACSSIHQQISGAHSFLWAWLCLSEGQRPSPIHQDTSTRSETPRTLQPETLGHIRERYQVQKTSVSQSAGPVHSLAGHVIPGTSWVQDHLDQYQANRIFKIPQIQEPNSSTIVNTCSGTPGPCTHPRDVALSSSRVLLGLGPGSPTSGQPTDLGSPGLLLNSSEKQH